MRGRIIMLLAAAMAAMCAHPTFANSITVDGITWTYTVVNGEASLGGGSSSSTAVPKSTTGALMLPSVLDGYPVTSIESYAFYHCRGLTNVTIPSSVMCINDYAFFSCTNLTNVTIPDSVTNIGYSAFSGCSGLTSVTIPASMTSIGNNVFQGCNGLTNVTIPNSVTNIGYSAFSGCSGLTSVTIPDSVMYIGAYAFCYCSGLTSVTIPDGLTAIEQGVFCECVRLADIAIPDTVTSIGDEAFSCCSNLTYITISTNVQSIGYCAFSRCRGLTNLTIQSGVTSIGRWAFESCSGLTSISIPDSVTSIGQGAFNGCCALTSITLPFVGMAVGHNGSPEALFGSVFGESPFDGSIPVKQSYVTKDYGYAADYAYSVFYLPQGLKSVTITSTTMLGSGAFYGCTNIVSLALPGSITSVGKWAFAECRGLRTLIIDSDTPKVVSGNPISGCTIKVPNGSTGWDADIPGMWNGWKIDYIIPIVQFDPNGGTVSTSVMQTAAGLIEEGMPVPKKTGYSFDGWFTEINGGDEIKQGMVLDGSVHVYAHWGANRYAVIFDSNGGGGIMMPTNLVYDHAYMLPSNSFVNSGYSFTGWALTPGGEVEFLDAAIVSNLTSQADGAFLLYAQWTPNQYVVMFDANGGNGGTVVTLDYGTTIVPPGVTREGYTFAGWSPALSETVSASNVTYTAQWMLNEYTITLNLNGGEGEGAAVVNHGSVVGDIPVPTKALNEFAGWFTAAEDGERVDETTIIAGAMELFAHWNRTYYAVSFDANGGSLAAADATIIVESGGALGERALPLPTRDGQLFVGWFTAEDDGEKIDVNTTLTDDVTYYAHWIPTTTILIDVDESYTAEADGSFTLSLPEIVFSSSTPKFNVKGLPTGLRFDARTGSVTGKATKPGTYKVTVSAINATVKKPVSATFEITVPNMTSEKLPNLEPGRNAYGTIRCGVAFNPTWVDCTPEKGWTVKVAGLPAGLKYDAKTGKITGVPTKAGTFTVTFTASKKGEANQVATITLETAALPDWAQGTFTGYVKAYGGAPGYEDDFGFATMTVAANGKISGKLSLRGANWAFGATGFAASDGGDHFEVEAEAKAGKTTMPVTLLLQSSASPAGGGATLLNASVEGSLGGSGVAPILLWRNVWKDKATAAAAKAEIAKWEGVYTVSAEDGGYLSLTVGKDGTVKASGKLSDGTSVSASAPLMYHVFKDFFTVLCAAPSAYKGGYVWLPVGFGTARGQLGTLGESLVVCSRNPQASGEYGAGFTRQLGFTGAYYDKTKKLNDYYDALRLELGSVPILAYSQKVTYFDEGGKKTTESFADAAYALDTLGQAGLTAAVNEKGVLVVSKATKPVQDKETKEWFYNGTNDGAMTLSFAQATGIFKGSYTFWYDYVSAYDETTSNETRAHTSKKVSFEGILVQGLDEMRGFYLWDVSSGYADPKTGKPKTYKYKVSHLVTLSVP